MSKTSNPNALYAVIDLKSFYASCECATRGLDIFTTPLVVCDPERTMSTIVMSVTPFLKEKYGVGNVCRRRDLPDVEGMIIAQPRMSYYIEMSSRVVSIFLDFVDESDLHVYSIDESFLNIGPYLKAAKQTPEEFCASIQKRIKDELGLVATAGIGPNMFLAKVCLDNEGKKKPPYIGRWTMDDVQTKLWAIEPITKVWGISSGIERRLKNLGIRSLKQLACANKKLIEKEFGVIGTQLINLANGIDETNIREKYVPKEQHLNQGQTLSRDYNKDEAKLLIREMCDDICLRLRLTGMKAGVVSLYVGYGGNSNGGFNKQTSLDIPTDDNDNIYDACMRIYKESIENLPIRGLSVGLSKLGEYEFQQQSIFEDGETNKEKRNLYKAIDEIQLTFGRNYCLRGTALTKGSTIRERHNQIGGHKA
ncbi:MAG: damage repair protein [Bacilli bacterium]|nr:damage repair protein [Bacilli bacterium]